MTDTKNTVSDERLDMLLRGAKVDAQMQTSARYKREAEEMVSILTHYQSLRASIPGGVGVKGLGWVQVGRHGSLVYRSESAFGDYQVDFYEDSGAHGWEAFYGDTHELGCFATMDEAKAAAQADYERRTLSALSDAPVVTDEQKAIDALRPFYDAVFNDNGDITVNGPYPYGFTVAAYFSYRKLTAALGGE